LSKTAVSGSYDSRKAGNQTERRKKATIPGNCSVSVITITEKDNGKIKIPVSRCPNAIIRFKPGLF
jgi:hypothetical protein